MIKDDKGEVLMIRRKVSKTGINGSVLQWTFPGGKQRLNETREECVKREVLIETGYDIESIKYISLRLRSKFPVTIIYFFNYLFFIFFVFVVIANELASKLASYIFCLT
ncbi:MAG: NUDIX hydrolase [Minisyncoccia bacterium]